MKSSWATGFAMFGFIVTLVTVCDVTGLTMGTQLTRVTHMIRKQTVENCDDRVRSIGGGICLEDIFMFGWLVESQS